MAYDEIMAERIRHALARKKNIEKKKMFGGVGFLLNGNRLVGIRKDSLLVRLDPEQSNGQRWPEPCLTSPCPFLLS